MYRADHCPSPASSGGAHSRDLPDRRRTSGLRHGDARHPDQRRKRIQTKLVAVSAQHHRAAGLTAVALSSASAGPPPQRSADDSDGYPMRRSDPASGLRAQRMLEELFFAQWTAIDRGGGVRGAARDRRKRSRRRARSAGRRGFSVTADHRRCSGRVPRAAEPRVHGPGSSVILHEDRRPAVPAGLRGATGPGAEAGNRNGRSSMRPRPAAVASTSPGARPGGRPVRRSLRAGRRANCDRRGRSTVRAARCWQNPPDHTWIDPLAHDRPDARHDAHSRARRSRARAARRKAARRRPGGVGGGI